MDTSFWLSGSVVLLTFALVVSMCVIYNLNTRCDLIERELREIPTWPKIQTFVEKSILNN